jgi:hypothetical protein
MSVDKQQDTASELYQIDSISFARLIKGLNDKWVTHAYVELPNKERRGVFLNVGPVIVRKGDSNLVHIEISEKDRFRESWSDISAKVALHISKTSEKKLSVNRLNKAIENPFKPTGLQAKLANRLSLKDNRGSIVKSLFPNSSTEENGWALLQFEGVEVDGGVFTPMFILHGMLLIREDCPEEFDVMNLTEQNPIFDDMESCIPVKIDDIIEKDDSVEDEVELNN